MYRLQRAPAESSPGLATLLAMRLQLLLAAAVLPCKAFLVPGSIGGGLLPQREADAGIRSKTVISASFEVPDSVLVPDPNEPDGKREVPIGYERPMKLYETLGVLVALAGTQLLAGMI